MKTLIILLKRYAPYIFLVFVVLLALRVFIPQIDELIDSIQALRDADTGWILLGVVIFFLGVPVLAYQYTVLALRPLRFGMTLRVQMAGLFVSKLLPSALGTISLNMYYLIKRDHSTNQAAAVIAMNSVTSGVAYLMLIITALSFSPLSLKSIRGDIHIPLNLVLFMCLVLVSIIYLIHRSAGLHAKIRKSWFELKNNLKDYRDRRSSVMIATLCNGVGSFANVCVMFLCAYAASVELTLSAALLAYTFGNIATALVPTPGGLGAAEAGIYSGLVFVGVNGPDALLVTLLYRLITYWLPIIPGYYYFWGLRKTLLSNFILHTRY